MAFQRPLVWLGSLALVLCIGGYYFLLSAPTDFAPETLVTIAQGAPAHEVAEALVDTHIIRQPYLLRLLLRITGESNSVQAGIYRFRKPQNLLVVAYRLVAGVHDLPPVRVTLIEGTTVRDMALRIATAFPTISTADFTRVAQPYEGYLFPDTYFFLPSATAESIVKTMRENFTTKTVSLSSRIKASGHSLSDIVVMASLVEKEARTNVNRRIVAGILWNRLARGMPLQVDAVFGYIKQSDTYSPSFADLKIDSPYNTYLYRGLPPGPIANPGLDALEAVLNPTKTEYVYYLTGNDDQMHYATTYAGHLENRRKYLD